jgi:hypothetical protein
MAYNSNKQRLKIESLKYIKEFYIKIPKNKMSTRMYLENLDMMEGVGTKSMLSRCAKRGGFCDGGGGRKE